MAPFTSRARTLRCFEKLALFTRASAVRWLASGIRPMTLQLVRSGWAGLHARGMASDNRQRWWCCPAHP